MEKAYIVLAHKNPEQVMRLITALSDNHSSFFLHIDKKACTPEWRDLILQTMGVAGITSLSASWGGFNLVEATLSGMRAIMAQGKTFDSVSVISGQHYPVKSNSYISDYLSDSKYQTFLEYTSIPDYDRWKIRGGLYRIDKYFFGLSLRERYMAKAFNYLSGKMDILKRQFPENMKPYAGSQWFTTDNYATQYILNFVKNNPAYTAFHKHTFAPDELFFHNILLNADDERIQAGITNNNLLYMKWPDRNSGHPEILTASDRHNITNSNALFARKFDAHYDARILDMIDEERGYESLAAKQGA